ncbi:hypothetical protein SDJN03_24358, partial [Cucurbita argyrosperma subsp. sororia]
MRWTDSVIKRNGVATDSSLTLDGVYGRSRRLIAWDGDLHCTLGGGARPKRSCSKFAERLRLSSQRGGGHRMRGADARVRNAGRGRTCTMTER